MSSRSRRPNTTVFLDESLGTRVVADALRALRVKVEVHRDHFPPGTPDEHWLTEVGRRGWIVFSKDRRIKQRRLERRALSDAGVQAFLLTAADLSGADMASAFVVAWPRIAKVIAAGTKPLIATVSARGAVRILR